MGDQQHIRKPPFSYMDLEEIVYLFQGGGALGSFQVGVFHALEEEGYAPDWMVGISIGSINSAIIAGNPPTTRLEKLYKFWDLISHHSPPGTFMDEKQWPFFLMWSALGSLLLGQKGFFSPRELNPWFVTKAKCTELSFYDTSPLKETLHEVIDFDYLNKGFLRLTVGAVDIETGRLQFFDNRKEPLSAEHIMASCALPPGFPAIEIDKKYYWDGGVYSNTPLISIINDLPHKNRLCFVVDLFDSPGLVPECLDDVLERHKDITYAGQLNTILNFYDTQLFLQKKIATCIKELPEEMRKHSSIKELAKYGDDHNVHVAKIIYRPTKYEYHSKDYEFSSLSAKRHLIDGYINTKKMLANPNWWKDEDNVGTLVHTRKEDLQIEVGDPHFRKEAGAEDNNPSLRT